MFRSAHRWGLASVAGLAALVSQMELVLAQAPGQPSTSPTTTITSGRSLTLEWIITIAMCGVALYAVCRSSHRN